ncbi:hypothetical protein HETIRDRAFT_460186 [Heterobasidion irregulare TC 32-1]|uniref:Uncharacterized protein n=1 Tax=Heterobasidion irregulare (strain TC 32-1) TaxID=747525 RepID=W4K0Z8_HETIT|nr:uncharacterized protein HETIRDRAFT_460186 [Heterobasidion irregulare TC 32-1]ETW79384.1 hypothetical protein HETIRDRAFT_460186 [Heterobasidion irregulare TC 32-1]
MPALPTLPNVRSPAHPLTVMPACPFFRSPPARLLDPITTPSISTFPPSTPRYTYSLPFSTLGPCNSHCRRYTCSHPVRVRALICDINPRPRIQSPCSSPRHHPSARQFVRLIPSLVPAFNGGAPHV